MRRTKITRSIASTEVTVLVLNTETVEPSTEVVTIVGAYKDEKAVLKAVTPIVEKDSITKAVKITSFEVKEAIYGMWEDEFLAVAKIMTADRKFIDEVEDTETDEEPATDETDEEPATAEKKAPAKKVS